MEAADSNKPATPVIFTEMENIANQKMTQQIQKLFLQNHVEITSPANSDLAGMIRDEKMMYANLGIAFTVQAIAANDKRKTQ